MVLGLGDLFSSHDRPKKARVPPCSNTWEEGHKRVAKLPDTLSLEVSPSGRTYKFRRMCSHESEMDPNCQWSRCLRTAMFWNPAPSHSGTECRWDRSPERRCSLRDDACDTPESKTRRRPPHRSPERDVSTSA